MVQVGRREDPALSPTVANAPNQCPGINPSDGNNIVAYQIMCQRIFRAIVAPQTTAFSHNEARHMGSGRFAVLHVDADIPDHRISHRDDLTAIARVRQYLLIASDRCVETDLAVSLPIGPYRDAFEHRTVFQRQEPALVLVAHLLSSPARVAQVETNPPDDKRFGQKLPGSTFLTTKSSPLQQ